MLLMMETGRTPTRHARLVTAHIQWSLSLVSTRVGGFEYFMGVGVVCLQEESFKSSFLMGFNQDDILCLRGLPETLMLC